MIYVLPVELSKNKINEIRAKKVILTYNLKHNRDFSTQLDQAKKIAKFAIKTKSNSSKDVRYIGLKSAIANQILRKYRRKGIKKTFSVKLTIPGQSIKWNDKTKLAKISCVNLELDCKYLANILKKSTVLKINA